MTNEQRRKWCEQNHHIKFPCQYCGEPRSRVSLSRHEAGCYKNPNHPRKKSCAVCGKDFIAPSGERGKKQNTCSYGCSNTFYRSGENNGMYRNIQNYQTVCFLHHGKKCIVCGEENIVAAHHMNENHTDDRPENLVPLCPTHHCYWHSGYRNLIEKNVRNYLEEWLSRRVG